MRTTGRSSLQLQPWLAVVWIRHARGQTQHRRTPQPGAGSVPARPRTPGRPHLSSLPPAGPRTLPLRRTLATVQPCPPRPPRTQASPLPPTFPPPTPPQSPRTPPLRIQAPRQASLDRQMLCRRACSIALALARPPPRPVSPVLQLQRGLPPLPLLPAPQLPPPPAPHTLPAPWLLPLYL
jgi:Wiskott-Aldrich syndrome protein